MRKSIAIFSLILLSLLLPQQAQTQFNFGGYTFPNQQAFADLAAPVGDLNQFSDQVFGKDINGALTDINLATYIRCSVPLLYVEVRFLNNAIVNGNGADFVVFEWSVAEGYQVAVSTDGTSPALTPFRTYYGTQAINLDEFGIAANAHITLLAIAPNVLGGTEGSAEIQDIGALNSSATTTAGVFDFNDGTVQGWTMTGAFDGSGHGPLPNSFTSGWKDQVNFPSAPGLDPAGDHKGSMHMSTLGGHGISAPGETWWIMQLHSPDLTGNTLWQTARGYTCEIAECMASLQPLYANLFVRVYDQDQAKDRYFTNNMSAQELRHDIYGDAVAQWNHLSFNWHAMSNFPTRYVVKEIFINLWGKLAGGAFEGGLYVDDVMPIPGAMAPVPNPPANVVAHVINDQIHIQWQDNSDNETGFNLEFRDNGFEHYNWGLLATLPANTISYQMDNPVINRTYYFRAAAVNANGSSDYSDADTLRNFINLQYIKILSPNGGETLAIGSTQTITWTNGTYSRPSKVSLFYSIDGGSNWIAPAIAENINNSGSFAWMVPNAPTQNCVLKLKNAAGDFPYDLTNKPFSIAPATAPVLSVTPTRLDFGAAGDTLSFWIKNAGGGNLTWDVTEQPNKPWLIAWDILYSTATNARLIVHVNRSPLTALKDSLVLHVTSNGGSADVKVLVQKTASGLPPNWTFTANTGNNAVIVLPVAANPNIDGAALANGDYIGVFSSMGLCCGWSIWNGQNLSLTAWGDNDQTPAIDGLGGNEMINYRIFRPGLNIEYAAIEVGYSDGNGRYAVNGYMVLNKFTAHTAKTVTLHLLQGWNMFSVNVLPPDASMATLMQPIAGKLVIVKNNAGQTYIPEYQINNIGNLNFKEGYQAYLRQAADLDITGTPADPRTPIALPPGWSMISYLPDAPINAGQALASIHEQLVIAKNNDGQNYIPQFGINTIGDMKTGQGFQTYLKSAGTLIYQAGRRALAKREGSAAVATDHFTFVERTGDNATLVIPAAIAPGYSDGQPLAIGDEIGIFTSTGLCCGAIAWPGANTAITIWGDDSQTPEIDGFQPNDTLRFRVWKKRSGAEYRAQANFQIGSLPVYTTNGFYVLAALVGDISVSVPDVENPMPEHFTLQQNFPNPFNSNTMISYSLAREVHVRLAICDVSGKTIADLVDEQQKSGIYKAVWQAGMNSSGIYFIVLQAGPYKRCVKCLLLK